MWSVRTTKISHFHNLYLRTYSPAKLVIFLKFSILLVTFFKNFLIFSCKQNFKVKYYRTLYVLKIRNFEDHFHMTETWMSNIWICITAFAYLLFTTITVANLIIWLINKLYHCFSVTTDAVMSEFSWKGLSLKGGNKRPFKDLKICKAVKSKHERSMFLHICWVS